MNKPRSLFSRVGLWLGALFGAGSCESAPALPPELDQEHGSVWTADHAANWWAYLKSPIGRDLMARGRRIAAAQATIACADQFHTSHSAGTAHGWNQALTWLESLSRASRVNEDPVPGRPMAEEASNTQTPEGAAALRELLAP